jgi:hypothetical protein
MDLNKLIQGYEMAIVSFVDEDGYPKNFPVKNFKIDSDKILLGRFKGIKVEVGVGQHASILFHLFKEGGIGDKSVRFQGQFTKTSLDSLEFTPKTFYSWKRSGLINSLRMIWNGKANTRKFFRQRNMKPPSMDLNLDI